MAMTYLMLNRVEGVEWIHVGQQWDQWQAFASSAELSSSITGSEFLD
jgi:hypothetical protein